MDSISEKPNQCKPAESRSAPIAQNFGGWPGRITACWRESVIGILETGRLIAGAKVALAHGEFEAMVANSLPFTARTAQRLMAIAADERISANPTRVSLLPAAWGTIYELTKLDDAELEKRFDDGTIRPDIERAEVASLRKDARLAPAKAAYRQRVAEGCTIADLRILASNGAQYGVIYADPPWNFEAYSEKGEGRAPDYETKPLDLIKELPVAPLSAENCVLLIWALMNQLPQALDVISAWGFSFKTVAFTWIKQNKSGEGLFTGMGYWTRANAEICLLATKGAPTRIDQSIRQVLISPIMEHSRKPDEFYDRIERLVGGPYLELYGRRPRQNWMTWGNEIPRASFTFIADNYQADPVEAPQADALDIPVFLRRNADNVLQFDAKGIGAQRHG